MFKLMDATLRDGSYEVNFGFTIEQQNTIFKVLQNAGIDYIEIGHGIGLGASQKGFGRARHTDEEYIDAASKIATSSKFGMFCIPGVADLYSLDYAIDKNMDFVRIGTDLAEIEDSNSFIKNCKDANVLVAANFMKSYALNPKDFAQKVLISESYGADVVYLVDSSGGMFPDDIKRYYDEIRKVSDISLGFHGHNNLNMAVINSIVAIDEGFDIVDSTLQGLGRSSGNAATEVLLAALSKRGFNLEYDLLNIVEFSSEYVKRLTKNKGIRAIDVVAGLSDFHTSYVPYIYEVIKEYQVNPLELIMKYSAYDKVNMNKKKLIELAQKLEKNNKDISLFDFESYIGGDQVEEE
jgi:4-hydroxy-2-oxovalerate aldolase